MTLYDNIIQLYYSCRDGACISEETDVVNYLILLNLNMWREHAGIE